MALAVVMGAERRAHAPVGLHPDLARLEEAGTGAKRAGNRDGAMPEDST